jgi:hypothetical protein
MRRRRCSVLAVPGRAPFALETAVHVGHGHDDRVEPTVVGQATDLFEAQRHDALTSFTPTLGSF